MSKSQINLPKTAFAMKANLPSREPEFLKFWDKINLYKELRNSRKGKEKFNSDQDLIVRMKKDCEHIKEILIKTEVLDNN